MFFSKYSTAKIKIWQHYLLTQGIRPDDKMTVIHLIHITCWPYHFTIGPFTRSNCCIKNFVKVFFRKVFWSCKPASKTLSKNADWRQICRNRNPILLFCKLWVTLMGIDQSNIFSKSFYMSLNLPPNGSLRYKHWSNFNTLWSWKPDTFDKVFFEHISVKNRWPNYWRILW